MIQILIIDVSKFKKKDINVLCGFINLGVFKVGQSLINNRLPPNWVLRLSKNKPYKKPQKKNQQILQPFTFNEIFQKQHTKWRTIN